MKNISYIIILILLFASCGSRKNLGTDKTRVIKDSVRVETQYEVKDTIITIPADSVTLKAFIKDLSEKALTKKQGRITASLRRIGDEIIADCDTEELELEIQYLNKIIKFYREREISDKETIRIPVKYIPKFIKLLAWIGGILVMLIIISIILKIRKII